MTSLSSRWLNLASISLLAFASGCTPGVDGGGQPGEPPPEPPPVDTSVTVTTGFDSTQAGAFTVGDPPLDATFAGGSADGAGSAWVIREGNTGVVTFTSPASVVDFSFQDFFGAAGLLKAAFPAARKVTCGVTGSGDAGEAYGSPLFVRGEMDDWANPPVDAQQFENLGDSDYQAEFELAAGTYAYKIATSDYSTEFANEDPTELGVPQTLAPAGFGVNGSITIPEDGCYNFALDVTDTAAPVLVVTPVDVVKGTGSEARIFDIRDGLIATFEGGGLVDVLVERGEGQALIGRVEIENLGEVGDVGVLDFSFTTDPADTPPVTVSIEYSRPDGDYSDVDIVFGGAVEGSASCEPVSADVNRGCVASIEAPWGSQVSYSVQVDGVEDASGSVTATEAGATQLDEVFSDDGLLQVPSPVWSDQIIYFLMTDRFANGDPSNDCIDGDECRPESNAGYSGGDLAGIVDQLDYIKGLGATAIWITPPVANQWWDPLANFGGYHGYWQRDPKRVDEHYGSLNEYRLLSDALHRNDMYLIQDVVVNHMGNFFTYPEGDFDPDDPSFNCLKNTETVPTTKPTLSPYSLNDCDDPIVSAENIYHWRPQIADFTDPEQELTWQLSDLDDLATENPVVREALRDAFGYWITEVGVDGFRVDTVKFVEHEFYQDWIHSDDMDTPGIDKAAESVGKLEFLSFGEVFETSAPFDDAGEIKATSYLGTESNPELPSVIQFPLYQENLNVIAGGQRTDQMTYRLEKFMDRTLFRDPFITPTFLDNHDVARWLTSGNRESLAQGLMFLMTLPGIPIVYMGTEQEFIETRQAMFAGGFKSGGQDWYDTESDFYRLIADLSRIRRANLILTRGELAVVSDKAQGAGGFAYRREYDGGTMVVLMNTADEEILLANVDTGVEAGTRLDLVKSLVSGAEGTVAGEGGLLSAVLPSRDMRLYRAGPQGPAPIPSVTIDITSDVDGGSFDDNFCVAGTVTGTATTLELVIDEFLGRATDIVVGDPGCDATADWSAIVDLSTLPLNDLPHTLVVFDPASGAASETAVFTSTFQPPTAVVEVADPQGDDAGPSGAYVYPTDISFTGTDNDMLGVTAVASGRTLTLTFSMVSINTSFGSENAGNGFDHTSFNVWFDDPDRTGTTVLPEINATAPVGFEWDFQHRVYGFGQGLHSSEGATADFRGNAITGTPDIVVDKDAKTIAFTYDADNVGRADWTGVRVYVTAWDIDGLEDTFRPLEAVAESFKYGGRQSDADPLIMDDLEIFTIPPPPP